MREWIWRATALVVGILIGFLLCHSCESEVTIGSAEEEPAAEAPAELPAHLKPWLGSYALTLGPHRGRLVLFDNKGRLGGYVTFSNWGKGAREYLRSLRASASDISFVRSCSGAECGRIGSGTPFRQEFQGSKNGNSIVGKYTGDRSSGNFRADR